MATIHTRIFQRSLAPKKTEYLTAEGSEITIAEVKYNINMLKPNKPPAQTNYRWISLLSWVYQREPMPKVPINIAPSVS